MLSYRHVFHAGNHADVLKHLVLVQILGYLTAKAKPLWYVDTHAGAGLYVLDSGVAAEHGEHRDGIGRLWQRSDLPPALHGYRELLRRLNPDGRLARYPGSPWLAQALLRPGDRLWLHELHPADHTHLAATIRGQGVRVERADGLAALRGLLPPQPRRALVLMDPSYEVKADYRQVVTTLADALRRFPTGTYTLWYPLLDSVPATALPDALGALAAKSWLKAELRVRSAASGRGLYGSGMFIINPPYTLPAALGDSLPALAELLAQDDSATFHLDARID